MTTAIKNGKADVDKADVEKVAATDRIELPEVKFEHAQLTIQGVSPYIMHNWSQKSLDMLEGAQTGKAKEKRAPKVPDEEWRGATYVIPGREDYTDWQPGKYFIPASAFKHAYLYGCSQLDDVKNFPKTKATGWLFIYDDPELMFESVSLRKDVGRNPTQTVYRPQFNGWSVLLDIDYEASSITLEQAVSLLDRGLLTGGIGEWRPSAPKNKTGNFGRARVTGAKAL